MQQQCLSKEHVESFKQQMVDVIRTYHENPNNINHLSVNEDDDNGLIVRGSSGVVDNVDVTRVGSSTQPIPITLSVVTVHDGAVSHPTDNMSQPQSSVLAPSAETRKPGGSEMLSDAEYYTPVGSPDESRPASTVVCVDDLIAAASLPAAVGGKVGN